MGAEVIVDPDRGLMIPAEVGRNAGLSPGASVRVEDTNDGWLLLRPEHEEPPLEDQNGFLVIRGGGSFDIRALIELDRERRDWEIMGLDP